jgi:peptide/nickel transport system permease protein
MAVIAGGPPGPSSPGAAEEAPGLGSPGSAPGRVGAVARRIGRWALTKLVRAVATLVGVAILVFLILRVIPGNQITASLGVSAGLLTPAQTKALDHFYGIGQSLPQQFWQWADGLLHGNLGLSVQSGRTVTSLIGAALPVTLELAIVAMIVGLILGIGAGVLAAAAPGKFGDYLGQSFALFGLGIPNFVIGSGLVAVFAQVFHYFPSSRGYASLGHDPWLNFQQIIFPAITLGIGVGAAVMRTTRGAMLDVSKLAFVRSARGKGLRNRTVVIRHILRNALVPITTMSGIQFGYLLGGTVIVEQIFVLPGLGRLLLTSVNEHDYAVAQGVTLIFAIGFIVVNILTDALYAVIDPRVRT